jgi:hypothetical protein
VRQIAPGQHEKCIFGVPGLELLTEPTEAEAWAIWSLVSERIARDDRSALIEDEFAARLALFEREARA